MTLAMASITMAVPAPQQNNGNLDTLISNVFGGPTTAAPSAENRNTSGDLGSLINEVFGQSTTTTPRTTLGTQNKQRPKPKDCECVPYYQCREGTILDNGIGLIDIRSDFGDDNNSTSTIPGKEG